MSIKDGIVGAMVVGGGSGGGGGTPVVPNINATAESLPAGSEASVEKSGTNTNVTFNFGIPRGADGQQGAPGATGPAGPQGEQGPQGPAGPTGQQGPTGAQGPAGPQGETGPQGSQGIQGEKGDQGTPFLISKIYANTTEMNEGYATDGLQEGQLVAIATDTGGEQGGYIYAKGPTQYDFFYDISTTEGIQGPQGPQGEQGPQGPAGPAGATGATGPAGPQGPEGPQGEKGNPGEAGSTGPAGQAATIQVGTVTTGEPGTQASVTNSGTSTAAVLDFVIPQGQPGSGGGGTATAETVPFTLTAAGWKGEAALFSQTATVQGITQDNSAVTGPATQEDATNAANAGVRWEAQGENTLSYTAQRKPAVDLKYNALILSSSGGTEKTFADATWEEIAQAIESKKYKDLYNLHDEKDVGINTVGTMTLEIAGFDHDYLDSNTDAETAAITLLCKGLTYSEYQINNINTTSGGFPASLLYQTLSNQFFNNLPKELQDLAKTIYKWYGMGPTAGSGGWFGSKIWIPLVYELFGEDGDANPDEHNIGNARQYPIFTDNESRTKHTNNGTGIPSAYALGSVRNGYNGQYCCVTDIGEQGWIGVSKYYICFGLCI